MKKMVGDLSRHLRKTSAFSQERIAISTGYGVRALGLRPKPASYLLNFLLIQVASPPAGKYPVVFFVCHIQFSFFVKQNAELINKRDLG